MQYATSSSILLKNFLPNAMKATIENLKKSEVKITVEVSEKTLLTYKSEAAKLLQDQVKIDGFRPGHIPLDVLEKHVGEKSFKANMMEIALSDTYEKAIKENNIKPVSYPKVNVVSEDPFKYEAIVSVFPEVTIKSGYEKIKVAPKKQEVTEAEMEEVLQNLIKRGRKWHDVERLVQKNDRVEIDFDGKDMQGVPLDGTSSKNHPVIIGENYFIPGFEEELIGLKKDEEKDFEITFPKDYHSKSFQEKKVKFHVKINRIEESETQELNDAFAEELTEGKHKTLADLKKEIKTELGHQKEHDGEIQLENDVIEKLSEYFEAEVPDAMVEREIDLLLERLKSEVTKTGMKWEDYEALKQQDGKDIRAEFRVQAEKQVLIRLGIEKLYEMEKIEVTDDDVKEEIAHQMGHYPKDYAEKMKDYYAPGTRQLEQLRNQLMLKNLIKKHKA